MSIHITSWSGRLGNNISQLVNTIIFADYFNINKINYPSHYFFKGNHILINLNNKNSNKNYIKNKEYHDIFFSRKKICEKFEINEEIFDNTEIDIYSILKNIVNINSSVFDLNLTSNDLIIHIRSGDVYSNNPHPGWVQPPLSFYNKVINDREWRKIYLICEDDKSPIIKPLLKKYKNIIFKLQPLDIDILYIFQCKNICFGMGSFVPALLLFNQELNTIYYPSYCYRPLIDILKYKNKKVYELNEYIQKGEWKNTNEQRNIMLEYEI